VSPASRRGRRTGNVAGIPRSGARRYPRTARVRKLLQEVLAEALERLAVADERLSLLTITDVTCDAEFQTATVLFASLDEDQLAALGAARVRLQAEVGRQVRLRRTPLLTFVADPAVEAGSRIEDILANLERERIAHPRPVDPAPETDPVTPADGDDPGRDDEGSDERGLR
jgi:ribosome-binding factor A